MKVRFSNPARIQLDSIYSYIAKHNPAAALRVKIRIRRATEQLGHSPYIAPASDIPGVRVWTADPYPYRTYYTIRNREVFVVHIRHTSRRPPGADDL